MATSFAPCKLHHLCMPLPPNCLSGIG
ncbi:hypothetical protein BC937DRAFT_86290 [Endogone sp. FLAS-F59071]|nr:hypothetical protein BC937DRAFT_86290 [Endogone sp. FLAS-F59071]|eukprot:RUS20142.1 hypothetical protein BC937DRAFT_86290 [Endogone sp. FLAS-F59071]